MSKRFFRVEIKLGNAAMRRPDDVAAALEETAMRLRRNATLEYEFEQSFPISDQNGNTVGMFIWPGNFPEDGD